MAMPAKSDLFERPSSIRSGPPLEQKVVVHHRSDILLQEQVNVYDEMNRVF